MNITQALRLSAFLVGTIIVISGITDLGTLGNTSTYTFLSNGGNGVLKIVIGLILMTIGAKTSFVLAIVNLTFDKNRI